MAGVAELASATFPMFLRMKPACHHKYPFTIDLYGFFLAEELGNVGPTAQVPFGGKSVSENSKWSFGASFGVGSARAELCGDAPASPPWPPPKSTAAGPLSIFIQALIPFPDLVVFAGRRRTRPALSGSPLRRFASSEAVVIWPQPPPPSVPVFPPVKT